ncbi:hypothetical protein BZA05DRAFT_151703 [Tricharina praecox]|uniref:uncharacterized protein n=1 Tax=Tricharina praecox TaxID=43433 RepID=UPI0022201603|nr:uncharacterized protein BZA05DRAFT_151703 [Tricharina praecox]KAI5844840.1 hypothetical protein BZA05DRAFT_151703 [Tricharina praecox]
MGPSARLTRVQLLPRISRSSLLPRLIPASLPAISRNFHPCGPQHHRHAGFRREHEQYQRQQPVAHEPITSESTRGETTTDRSVEDPPVDTFSSLNVYEDIPPPGSAIETIYEDGFIFSSGVRFFDGSGALMLQGEVFRWRPAERGGIEEDTALRTGVLELPEDVWGALDVVSPKPELLIVGTGRRTLLLSKKDRARITEMGMRMDVMDTTHAASQYNLLATERSPMDVAAALMVDAFGSRRA